MTLAQIRLSMITGISSSVTSTRGVYGKAIHPLRVCRGRLIGQRCHEQVGHVLALGRPPGYGGHGRVLHVVRVGDDGQRRPQSSGTPARFRGLDMRPLQQDSVHANFASSIDGG